jgi:signal transduction histidine kinase
MRFSRFERKILAALIAVAIVPLVGALVLGQRALREAYEVGVNPRVGDELERGLAIYREHFAALKLNASHLADRFASDHQLLVSLSAGDPAAAQQRIASLLPLYPAVARVELLDPRGDAGFVVEPAEGPRQNMRELSLARSLPVQPPLRLRVTVGAPAAPFTDYQRAGELVEVFARLQTSGRQLSTFYLVVYMGFLLSVIAVAVAVGIIISRRVTRRVAVLAAATERVGAGDLSVQVPSDVQDEIGELTNAFNAMVRDIRNARGRIEYLQRIGAWQEFARRLAHEIKNPLTPIQLAVQEVHRSYSGADEAYRARLDDALAIVEEEVATLRRLVGEFSAFARLPEASLEEADLNEFLRDASRSLETIPEEYGADETISVRCELARGALPVFIDAMMLKRGLDNLVRNSVQALLGARAASGKVCV